MSVKTLTRVAAASAVLGVAVLTPSVAQAKNPVDLAAVNLTACPGSGLGDVANAGSVSGATFNVSAPVATGIEYDIRVRYSTSTTPTSTRVFGKSRDFLVTSATGVAARSGTIAGSNVRIYRIDYVDTVNELLVYTTDGIAGCD
jgi:hypothetical protein